MEFLKELWAFLRVRKKLWLAPIIIVMLILGGLLILAQGSVVAPFIYTLFQELRMYILAVGNYVLYKEHQDESLKENYEERYELD